MVLLVRSIIFFIISTGLRRFSIGGVKTGKGDSLSPIDAQRDHEALDYQMFEEGLIFQAIVLLGDFVMVQIARFEVREVSILPYVGISEQAVERLAHGWLLFLLSHISYD